MRRGNHGLQDGEILIDEAFYRVALKQVSVVFDRQFARHLGIDRKTELELCAPVIKAARLPHQVLEHDIVHRSIGHVEENLRQRRATAIPTMAKLLNQTVKRNILILKCLQGIAPYLAKKRAKLRIAPKIGA